MLQYVDRYDGSVIRVVKRRVRGKSSVLVGTRV